MPLRPPWWSPCCKSRRRPGGGSPLVAAPLTDHPQDADKCISMAPKFAKGYSRLGLAKFKAGDLAGAIKAYTAGLAADPSNTGIADGLAEVRLSQIAVSEETVAIPPRAEAAIHTRAVIIPTHFPETQSCPTVAPRQWRFASHSPVDCRPRRRRSARWRLPSPGPRLTKLPASSPAPAWPTAL